MKHVRRLRRLAPDRELLRRRAAGETLRGLALDYGVAHTTLSRYFARPDITRELRVARAETRAERNTRSTRQDHERDLRRRIHARAKDEAARARHYARQEKEIGATPRRAGYAGWLDERDTQRLLLRSEQRSTLDDLAEAEVEAGGGIKAVIEATGLQSLENAASLIDPGILVRAFANDRPNRVGAVPESASLRRLVPDHDLIGRRAAGESLRRLAEDYGVAHTTLSRYFRRVKVAQHLAVAARRSNKQRRYRAALDLASGIRQIRCEIHGRNQRARCRERSGHVYVEYSCCCSSVRGDVDRFVREQRQRFAT